MELKEQEKQKIFAVSIFFSIFVKTLTNKRHL